jgi:hypothetical protein
MPDWLFHWTHDEVFKEVLKVSIPALGSILAALIAWYGIRRTAKVTQEALENSKEATPPELLRLEKWSTILQESKDYPQEIKEGLDLAAIYSTYNDVLVRATLENRIMNLGIQDEEVENKLMYYINTNTDKTKYPHPKWNSSILNFKKLDKTSKLLILYTSFLIIFNTYIDIRIGNYSQVSFNIILGIICFIIVWVFRKYVFINPREKYIIFRNAYRAFKYTYLIDECGDLVEIAKEGKERSKFKKSREYKKWEKEIKEKGLDWGTWNYGLNIDWNNDPDARPLNITSRPISALEVRQES